MDSAGLPLRERKKRQTRDDLASTALALFSANGFAATTLDELCAAVGTSKRTFFRYFTSKEDVAHAPAHDLWRTFLDRLRTDAPAAGPLTGALRAALLAALGEMNDDWPRGMLAMRRLSAANPTVDAHGLYFCETTTRESVAVLHERYALEPGDLRARLLPELLVAGWHVAVEAWADLPGEPTAARLAEEVARTLDAVPGTLSLAARPRPPQTAP